jgi:hypothetical protein
LDCLPAWRPARKAVKRLQFCKRCSARGSCEPSLPRRLVSLTYCASAAGAPEQSSRSAQRTTYAAAPGVGSNKAARPVKRGWGQVPGVQDTLQCAVWT